MNKVEIQRPLTFNHVFLLSEIGFLDGTLTHHKTSFSTAIQLPYDLTWEVNCKQMHTTDVIERNLILETCVGWSTSSLWRLFKLVRETGWGGVLYGSGKDLNVWLWVEETVEWIGLSAEIEGIFNWFREENGHSY